MDAVLLRAINAKRGAKYVEFKGLGEITSPQDWCEVIKDIVAIANAGGATLVLGKPGGGSRAKSNGKCRVR